MAKPTVPSATKEIVESHERLKPVASHMLQILRDEGAVDSLRIFTVGKINIAEADVLERFLKEKMGTALRVCVLLGDNHGSNALPKHVEEPKLFGEKASGTPHPTGKSVTPAPNP